MQYFRAVTAVLVTTISTGLATTAVFLLLTLLGVKLESIWSGTPLFVFAILCATFILNACTRFLYPAEAAALSALGGVRFGSSIEAMSTGKGATWPFAKLLAEPDRLWMHTPWGTFNWANTDSLVLRRSRSIGGIKLVLPPQGGSLNRPVIFLAFRRDLESRLRALGYRFEE